MTKWWFESHGESSFMTAAGVPLAVRVVGSARTVLDLNSHTNFFARSYYFIKFINLLQN
jgi:hypothetical protein